MAVSKRIADLLTREKLEYSTVHHAHSETSDTTAEAAHVSGERLAKAILLKDNRGYLLAVVPATHALETGTLNQKIRRPMIMAAEAEIARLFPDCEVGAIPAIGRAYGLTTVVEHSLCELPEVFFEAGDHETLVRVDCENFKRLVDGALFASFSHHKG
ncbi:MAG: YbaK/EbsC family protein [Gammaproteobacteria bacterium]|nr:YbaK/EbsC family protein [Gammaproteobacteria bacterium]